MINPLLILNNIPNTLWKISAIILLLLVILFGIQTCTKVKEAHNFQNQLTTEAYNHKMAFDSVRTKDGTLIATQQQLLANKDAEIVKHIETEDKLKSLTSQVVIKTIYQIQKVYVPFKDSTTIRDIVDTVKGKLDTIECLPLPARFVKIDTNFQIDATVLKLGLEVNYLKIPNTTTVTLGETKGLFDHKSIVRVDQSNPYIKDSNINNIVVDKKTNTKVWKGITLGAGLTLGFEALITIPYLYLHK